MFVHTKKKKQSLLDAGWEMPVVRVISSRHSIVCGSAAPIPRRARNVLSKISELQLFSEAGVAGRWP